jgi:hypothetical protein
MSILSSIFSSAVFNVNIALTNFTGKKRVRVIDKTNHNKVLVDLEISSEYTGAKNMEIVVGEVTVKTKK